MKAMNRHSVIVMLTTTICYCSAPFATAQGKPVKERLATINAGSGPATLAELFDKSSVVVEGVVQGEHPADQVYPDVKGKPPVVVRFTLYDIAVREVFKKVALLPPNSLVQLHLPGGRRDKGTFIEDEFDPRLPTPKIGEEYVLFLKISTDPSGTWYIPTMGLGESVFLQDHGTITPRGSGPVARSFRGRPVTDLLDSLRKRGGKL